MYTQLSGRYTSLLVLLTLSYFKFVFKYYALVPILMLALTYAGLFFCIKEINRFAFEKYFNKQGMHTASGILLLLYIIIMPEPSTGFYWLSGCITHQLPVILLLFCTVFCLRVFFSIQKQKLNLLLSAIFLFAAIGCNEMLAMYLSAMLFAITLYCKKNKPELFTISLILFIVAVLGDIMLFSGSGQQNRAGSFIFQGSFVYAVSASFLKYILLISNLFSIPFFWFCIVSIIIFLNTLLQQ